MEGRFLLDVVVGQSTAIFELLTSEDQTLLIRGDALLVLNLRLDIVNGVRGFDIEGDSLSGQRLDEDLHTTTETEHQVERGLLLNVVVGESTAVFQLLSGKNQPLLIRGNSFLVLDLGLDIVNGIGRLDIERDGLSGQSLDKNLCA